MEVAIPIQNNKQGEVMNEIMEDIADTFYNGQFTAGVQELKLAGLGARDFLSYIEDLEVETNTENTFFNRRFFIELAEDMRS